MSYIYKPTILFIKYRSNWKHMAWKFAIHVNNDTKVYVGVNCKITLKFGEPVAYDISARLFHKSRRHWPDEIIVAAHKVVAPASESSPSQEPAGALESRALARAVHSSPGITIEYNHTTQFCIRPITRQEAILQSTLRIRDVAIVGHGQSRDRVVEPKSCTRVSK